MRMTLAGTGELQAGLEVLAPELGITLGSGGLEVRAVRWDRPELRVDRRGSTAEIHYRDKAGFFRGVGLLAERATEADVSLSERVAFRKVGPMVDVSQGNAVPRLDFLRGLLRKLALMGLNLVMLYCEDSYEVPGFPFFGYMRGRFRAADLRALDDYADMLGIELIPCIQTLGHLYEVLKWDAFASVRDDAHTLLVGEPETYQIIEHMIAAASEPVRSRRIHIGMDEAWNLGLGAYLARNGYRPKIDIMAEHLTRVVEIVQRLGLRPMMWSDMFFRATSTSNSYDQPGSELTEAARTAVPAGVELVYWSYHNWDTRFYQEWIERHAELAHGRTPVFAGGISNWRGWGPNYGMSLTATKAALAACESTGVEEILATLWGDDGTPCDLEACLLGLQFYAESCYGGDTSDDALSRRFAACCAGDARDFLALKDVDEAPGVGSGNPDSCNPSEYLLWQHPMLGLFDANARDLPMASHYEKLARQLLEATERNPRYRDVFTIYQKLCAALAVKAELGGRLVAAYGNGDRAGLRALAETELPAASAALEDLRDAHMRRWHAVYQPFGWEVIDARYGTALLALDAARWRIGEYLEGRVGRLEELEEPRLPFNGLPGPVSCQYIGRMQSASRLFWDVG